MDTEGPVFDALLKVKFVTKSWPDIRIQKYGEWQDGPMSELVRKAEQVYVGRDEEEAKVQARIIAQYLQPLK